MGTASRRASCWIVAGPNGAGKTTFALEYLPNVAGCRQFVNADLIASGMSPLAPEKERLAAARIFLSEIERYVRAGVDFGFETTLSGRGYLRLIRRLRDSAWRVNLIYLALPGPDIARARVAERVAHGGHNIPDADIERRYFRSLSNLFKHYAPAVDQTVCFFNASKRPETVFVQRGDDREVVRGDVLKAMIDMAGQ